VTSYWNVAYLPEVCRDSSMDNDIQFNTMIRIAGSWSSFGTAFAAIMETYGWKHVVILSDTTFSQCSDAASAINDRLTTESAVANNFTVYWVRLMNSPTANDIDDSMRQIRSRARGGKTFHHVEFPSRTIKFIIMETDVSAQDMFQSLVCS
jgi:hypothetical protein